MCGSQIDEAEVAVEKRNSWWYIENCHDIRVLRIFLCFKVGQWG
jgi:hypothetical protein